MFWQNFFITEQQYTAHKRDVFILNVTHKLNVTISNILIKYQ